MVIFADASCCTYHVERNSALLMFILSVPARQYLLPAIAVAEN